MSRCLAHFLSCLSSPVVHVQVSMCPSMPMPLSGVERAGGVECRCHRERHIRIKLESKIPRMSFRCGVVACRFLFFCTSALVGRTTSPPFKSHTYWKSHARKRIELDPRRHCFTLSFCAGAIFGGIMLTSAMVIKAPHPSYKVPGLDAGPAADGASKAAPVAPVVQVTLCLESFLHPCRGCRPHFLFSFVLLVRVISRCAA